MKLMSMAMLWLLLSLVFSAPTHAQPWDWQKCDTCYRNYSYTYGADSAFVLGAVGVSGHRVHILKDSLGVNLFLNYNGPTQIDTSTTGPVTEYIDWVNRTRRLLWEAAAVGIKVMYEPVNIQALGKAGCASLESYPGLNLDSTHIFDFMTLSSQGRPDSTIWGRYDVWGWRDDSTNGGAPYLMASKPRFTSEGMKPDGLFAMYDSITPGPQIDSSNYVRFTFTATADSVLLSNPSISKSTVIAYGIVYRRDTTNQSDSCICAHYRVMDTVKITKEMLEDDFREKAGDRYTNFHSRYYNLNEFPTLGHANNSQLCKDSANARLGRKTNTIEERDPRNNESFYTGYVEGSGRAIYRFYTTRRVPVQFLRASIDQHSLELLKRGAFDPYIQADVDAVFDQPLLMNTYKDFMVIDEPDLVQFRAYGILSSKIQHYRNLKSPTDKRKAISYIYKDYAGLRSFSGDLDSGKYKLMQGIITDHYMNGGQSKLPIKYGNPDKLGYKAKATWYRTESDSLKAPGDTAFWRMVCYNTTDDYKRYLTQVQKDELGYFRASRTAESSVRGPIISNVARAVDISRYRNNHLGPSSPVYNAVGVQGFMPFEWTGNVPTGWTQRYFHRTPTPEEITVQCWASLNCNVDGIVYGHIAFDGEALGVMLDSGGHAYDYGRLHKSNEPLNTAFHVDSMWLGLASRFAAVKRFSTEMKLIQSICQRLDYRREQMSVHDLGQSFNEIPMVDSLKAEQAYRDTIAFKGTGVMDPRDSTYLELTHFRPGVQDTAGVRANARYLLITNRRCWPIDHGNYSTGAAHGGSTHGFGNIDVRRPWIKLKNSTGVLADSFIVEKVGRENEWSRRMAVGTLDSLDWLEPGWGQLYRVRPIPAGVAPTGTAYNNGVHSENPSTDLVQRDRLTVYMRDSIVYLRATDSTGTWSREWMISDVADSAHSGSARVANNMHPVLATTRNDTALLVVWERRVGTSTTVEAAHFKGLPRRTNFPTPTRIRLTAVAKNLVGSWMLLTPAITGIDSGWVVAWASPTNGVEAVAVRNVAVPTATADVSTPMTFKATTIQVPGNNAYAIGGAGLYPTLATARITGAGGGPIARWVYMAWQQGTPNSANKQFILYRQFAAVMSSVGRPTLSVGSSYQHVSYGLTGCGFLHPSIAADSLGIAVAFQQNTWSERRVVLRFSDTASLAGAWRSTVYTWGGRFKSDTSNRYYERPSVTMFPSIPLSNITTGLQGALTWHWTNAANGVRNRQFLYRYRWPAAREIPVGQHPSMMLVPYQQVNPYEASGVFYRGDSLSGFKRSRTIAGVTDSVVYYPGVVRPTKESWTAATGTLGKVITGELRFGQQDAALTSPCGPYIGVFHTGLALDGIVPGSDGFVDYRDSDIGPGLPPSFFASPQSAENRVDTVTDGVKIARTSVFTPNGLLVPISRYFIGSDSLVAWLQSQPYDSAMGTPADIKVHLELVRASDSTVLWRGDTLSARAIGDSTVDHVVQIPLTGVMPGTAVYVRLKSTVTEGLTYDFSAGFQFGDDETSVPPAAKRTIEQGSDNGKEHSDRNAALDLSFAPNPTREDGTLEASVNVAGHVEFALYDSRGTRVVELPALDVEQPGVHRLRIQTESLPNGLYMIVGDVNGERVTIQVQVVR